MPLVRISLLKGKSREHIRAISDGIHQALVDTFEIPPDDRFHLVHQHEPEEFIYDRAYMGIQRTDDVVFIHIVAIDGVLKSKIMPALGAMLRRNISPCSICAGVVATSTANWCRPPALSIVSGAVGNCCSWAMAGPMATATTSITSRTTRTRRGMAS